MPGYGKSRARLTLTAVLVVALTSCGGPPRTGAGGDSVVLLHGLGRTDRSMAHLADRLAERGYRVTNVGYPSTEHSIEHLADRELAGTLARCCGASGSVHFVTHSMGGIVLRYYLEQHELPNLGRVVMLSPPNKGSEVADWVAESEFLQGLVGPALEELGTGPGSVPRELGPVEFELGVITGDRTINPLFSLIIPGEDDGQVSVESARVDGMDDFLVVPEPHTFIMSREEVVDQVIHFLEQGEFRKEPEESRMDAAAARSPGR